MTAVVMTKADMISSNDGGEFLLNKLKAAEKMTFKV